MERLTDYRDPALPRPQITEVYPRHLDVPVARTETPLDNPELLAELGVEEVSGMEAFRVLVSGGHWRELSLDEMGEPNLRGVYTTNEQRESDLANVNTTYGVDLEGKVVISTYATKIESGIFSLVPNFGFLKRPFGREAVVAMTESGPVLDYIEVRETLFFDYPEFRIQAKPFKHLLDSSVLKRILGEAFKNTDQTSDRARFEGIKRIEKN